MRQPMRLSPAETSPPQTITELLNASPASAEPADSRNSPIALTDGRVSARDADAEAKLEGDPLGSGGDALVPVELRLAGEGQVRLAGEELGLALLQVGAEGVVGGHLLLARLRQALLVDRQQAAEQLQ